VDLVLLSGMVTGAALNFIDEFPSVCEAVETAVSNYDFIAAGYEHDKNAIIYQIHNPEHMGYRLYIPVKAYKKSV